MADIFPAGDPRNALYNETLAGVGLAFDTELSGINEGLKHTEAESAYQEGEQTRQEPGVFRGIDNRSNSQGLLESGIEARRTGDQTADFAARRVQRQNSLKESREGASRRTEQARKRRANEEGKATATAGSEAYQDILNKPQVTAPSYPVMPAQAASKAPPGPGGVVPYEQSVPGYGFVRVGMPPKPRRK